MNAQEAIVATDLLRTAKILCNNVRPFSKNDAEGRCVPRELNASEPSKCVMKIRPGSFIVHEESYREEQRDIMAFDLGC